ncbi:secretory protein, partial [Fulvivirgaceae bacterium PWU5]|nr:secretory protein [Dawidia cretensis]
SFDPAVKARLIKTFFEVYPVLVGEYNKASIKEVTFFVDTTYKAVAEAGGGRVRFSPGWFKSHPGDIDVVTHEVMHLVQSYPH